MMRFALQNADSITTECETGGNIVQTPNWLFTCFAQGKTNIWKVNYCSILLSTKNDNCKRKARAKFRSAPHWEAGKWFTVSQETSKAGMKAEAPTQRLHKPLGLITDWSNSERNFLYLIHILFWYVNQDSNNWFS